MNLSNLRFFFFAPASCAAPQEYRCPPRGFHLICTCCLQPMPDRRAELSSQQVSQQCEWFPKTPVDAAVDSEAQVVFAAISLFKQFVFVSAPFQIQRCLRAAGFIIHVWRDCCANSISRPEVQGCAVFWQVCCASGPSVICTGAARGLAAEAAWLHSVVSVCFRNTASGGRGGRGGCCLLLGNFFNYGSLVALAHIHILGSFFICLCWVCVWLCAALTEASDTWSYCCEMCVKP